MGSAIACRQLVKRFGQQTVLDRIDFGVQPGRIVGLLGPSGSGKTTLIRCLAGILRPDDGDVLLMGKPIRGDSHKRTIGYMPQRPALYPELTLRENLLFFGRMQGLGVAVLRRRIAELTDLTGLANVLDRPLVTFSGGMKQRASLVATLVHEPQAIFLDEPTVGIDPVLRQAIWDHLRQLSSQGITIVLSTHQMDEADYCQDLAIMRDGHLLAQGTPEAIRSMVSSKAVLQSAGGTVERPYQHEAELLSLIRSDPNITDVRLHPATIEQAFMHLIAEVEGNER